MKLYLLYREYDDGWKNIQGIYDSEEKAVKINKILNNNLGTVMNLTLNKTKDLECWGHLTETDRVKIKSTEGD